MLYRNEYSLLTLSIAWSSNAPILWHGLHSRRPTTLSAENQCHQVWLSARISSRWDVFPERISLISGTLNWFLSFPFSTSPSLVALRRFTFALCGPHISPPSEAATLTTVYFSRWSGSFLLTKLASFLTGRFSGILLSHLASSTAIILCSQVGWQIKKISLRNQKPGWLRAELPLLGVVCGLDEGGLIHWHCCYGLLRFHYVCLRYFMSTLMW